MDEPIIGHGKVVTVWNDDRNIQAPPSGCACNAGSKCWQGLRTGKRAALTTKERLFLYSHVSKHILGSLHAHRVNAVAIDRQGLKCATVSDDGTMRVWGLQSGRCEVAMSIKSEGRLNCHSSWHNLGAPSQNPGRQLAHTLISTVHAWTMPPYACGMLSVTECSG